MTGGPVFQLSYKGTVAATPQMERASFLWARAPALRGAPGHVSPDDLIGRSLRTLGLVSDSVADWQRAGERLVALAPRALPRHWHEAETLARAMTLALQLDAADPRPTHPAVLVAGPGSWLGRAPLGNTGGANVGILTPMPIPEELRVLLEMSPGNSMPP